MNTIGRVVDVVLIHCNFRGSHVAFLNMDPPAGIGYLAAVLEQNGISVKIIDPVPEGLTKKDVENRINELKPRIVGLTCLTSYRHDAFEMAQRIKSKDPSCKIVIGGAHVSSLDQITLQRISNIDAIVRGEGEYTFLEYVKAILGNGTNEHILGLSYRDKSGSVIQNPARPLLDDLDSLPYPAFHLFEKFGQYPKLVDVPPSFRDMVHTGVISSRGCPFRCTYCSSKSIWTRKFRGRSAKNVVEEIQYLNDRFGIQYIRFYDDNFTVDKSRVIEICDEIIDRNLKIKWRCESRIDGTTKEMLQRMSQAGCHLIEYGIETGSNKVMENIKKKIRLEQVPQVVEMCKESGLEAKAFIMVGLPGETAEDFKKTIEISKYFDYCGIAQLMIFPGSDMYAEMKSKGAMTDEIWFQKNLSKSDIFSDVPLYTESFSEDELSRLKGIFYEEHPNYSKREGLSRRVFKNVFSRKFAEEIFSPRRLLMTIRVKMKSYRDYEQTRKNVFGK